MTHAPLPRSRPLSTHAATTLFLLLLTLALGAAEALHAQEIPRGQDTDLMHVTRRIHTIEPTSGPPGTIVMVSSADMPHITPIRVGVGALRTGFEAVAELLTGIDGNFSAQIAVPGWARWDRTHRFIVFDFYFAPIALSEPFYVTNAEGLLERRGTVTREGTCLLLETTEEDTFALTGATATLRSGAEVVLEGRLGEREACGEHRGLEVVSVRDPR